MPYCQFISSALRIGVLSLGMALLVQLSTFGQSAWGQDQLPVVATFSIVGDLTQKIGGDAISLTILVGPDEDAHAFEPTADAQRAVAGARVLIANGLGFEPWLDRLVEAAAFNGNVIVATNGITPLPSVETEHEEVGAATDHAAADPHAFQDPKRVLAYIDSIAAGLEEAAPASAGLFRRNAEALKQQFRALDADLMATIGALPAARKRVLTSHDAFQYFGRAYGVQFVGVQGVSTEMEPSAQDLRHIVEQINSGKIKAVFIETMNDPRFIETLAKDTGTRIGGDLYSDALSTPDGPASDLMSLFRHNQKELLKALQ